MLAFPWHFQGLSWRLNLKLLETSGLYQTASVLTFFNMSHSRYQNPSAVVRKLRSKSSAYSTPHKIPSTKPKPFMLDFHMAQESAEWVDLLTSPAASIEVKPVQQDLASLWKRKGKKKHFNICTSSEQQINLGQNTKHSKGYKVSPLWLIITF